jgi:hypothetical protein
MASYDYEYSKEKFIKYSVTLFLLFWALCVALISGFQFLNRENALRNGAYTTGIVAKIENRTNTDMDVWVYTVKFLHNNQAYYIENENGTSLEGRYRLDEKLKVAFLPDAPEKAIIDDPREHEYSLEFLLPASLCLAALFFALCIVRSIRKPITELPS